MDMLLRSGSSKHQNLEDIENDCDNDEWDEIWVVADTIVLVVGVVANATLLWLFLRERKSLSASKVLGLNLVAMNLVFLSIMPVWLVDNERLTETENKNRSAILSTHSGSEPDEDDDPIDEAKSIFTMFNLIGCPLLLTCMCIERYLAVVKPILYLRVRKWQYRMAVSAVVWLLTFFFCVITGLVEDITIVMVLGSSIVSCLLVIMLFCLGGVVYSLWQQSPAHSTPGNRTHAESPLKRRAVGNVLTVVAFAVVVYLPVLLMFPLAVSVLYLNDTFGEGLCDVLQLSLFFPRFGVLIGPLFYLAKARQMCRLGRTENN